jgi:hypothetical protein
MVRVGWRVGFVCVLVWGVSCCVVSGAFGLSGGRAYELVSPVFKGGYGAARIEAVAPDGEGVAFDSLGAFGGAPSNAPHNTYIARRSVSGWSTVSLMPPATVTPAGNTEDYSETLDSTLAFGEPGPNEGAAVYVGTEREFLLHRVDAPETAAGWEVVGPVLTTLEEEPFNVTYEGASGDFCHVVFLAGKEIAGRKQALLPEAGEAVKQLYDLARGCGGESPLRLVGVKNVLGPNKEPEVIDPSCPVVLGAASGKQSQFNAIAANGRLIFFTTNANRSAGGECDSTSQGAAVPSNPATVPSNPAILYVRVRGERTLQVSVALAGGCAVSAPCHSAVQRTAEFQGASEDGSRVFFTTKQPLVTEDTDEGNDLYMATIGCPAGEETCEPTQERVGSLVQVSHDPLASEAEVQGVVAVAPDASRVYFVARGVLTGEGPSGQGAQAQPVKGADNLYVYEHDEHYPNGRTVFVADMCSGPGVSGEVVDSRCPLGEAANDGVLLWLRRASQAQTAGRDGRFLLFSSYGRLVANDTDTAKDVYRFDAQTGALDRVSTGEDGYHENGNSSAFDAMIPDTSGEARVFDHAEMQSRAISEDGTRVVFTTAEPLSPAAVNGLVNVYEWYEEPGSSVGVVSLVSTGSAEESEEHVVISPSGRDVFFITPQGLVSQDGDGAPDVYDARIGGGFPSPPAEREPCSGDACQGPLTNPVPLLVPGGSVSQAPGGNFAPPVSKKVVKARKAKPKPKKRKRGKKSKASRHRGRAKRSAARSGR